MEQFQKKHYHSAIMQMFYRENGFYEYIPTGNMYYDLLEVLDQYESQIKKLLTGDKKLLELFEKFNDARDKLTLEESETYYEEGFKFGLRIGMEVGESAVR